MNKRFWLIVVIFVIVSLACNIPGGARLTATSQANLVPPATAESPSPTQLSPSAQPPSPTGTQPLPPSPTFLPPTDNTISTPIPATLTLPPKSSYALILVRQGDMLNVRERPGIGSPIVDQLGPQTTGVVLTGKQARINDQMWVEILRSKGGEGWVNSTYLTEFVPPATFCSDLRVNTLIDRLVEAVTHRDGPLFTSLVSTAHGLNLTYLRTGATVNYAPEEARWVFESTYLTNWGTHPASGEKIRGTFHGEVLPKIFDVLGSSFKSTCNDPALGPNNYIFQWPFEYHNINFYALHKPGSPGVELDWRTWLAGIEYVGGQPYLFALFHLFWEP